MKKMLYIILFFMPLCQCFSYSYAPPETYCPDFTYGTPAQSCEGSLIEGLNAEFRFSAFYPFNHRLRELYKKVWAEYEIELSTTFCNDLQVWFDAGYLSSHGRTRCFRNKTNIYLIPLSLGIKYLKTLECNPCIDIYLGAGAVYSMVRMKDHSPFVNQHVSDKGFGAVVKTGFTYHLNERFFLEGFLDYFYQRFSFSRNSSPTGFVKRHDLNISGLKLGFGAGVKF